MRICRMLRWKIQRARRGYSDLDVWGLDHHLLNVIVGGLTQLSEKTASYPAGASPEEWTQTLKEMAEKINVGRRISYGDLTKTELDALTATFEEGMDMLKANFFDLWD